VIPGEIICEGPPLELLSERPVISITVLNAGDRPIQVGSHYHFAESNPALILDRSSAYGHRLAILAGTSVRFEPGVERTVDLIPLAGRRVVAGLRNQVAGPLDDGTGPGRGPGAGAGAAGAGAAAEAVDESGGGPV
jgi:urease subunit beta